MAGSDTAIIFSAFGTSTDARDTYSFFESRARERFPGHDVLWAYTSRTLRGKMAREGVQWPSPDELLNELPGRGYRRAVVQSLHVVPGAEYEKLKAAARKAPLPVSLGRPLFSDIRDCDDVISALAGSIGDPAEGITVLAGHGSPRPGAQARYRQFSERLRLAYPDGVILAMVEGEPSWKTALDEIRLRAAHEVRFVPLMFVAGDHMINDVLGPEGSWASQLCGCRMSAAWTRPRRLPAAPRAPC